MFRKCALHTLTGLVRPRHGFQLRSRHAVASQVFSCGEHQDTEQGQVVRAERDPCGDSRPVPPRVKGPRPPPNCPRAPALSRHRLRRQTAALSRAGTRHSRRTLRTCCPRRAIRSCANARTISRSSSTRRASSCSSSAGTDPSSRPYACCTSVSPPSCLGLV